MNEVPDVDGVQDLSEIGRGGFGVVYRGIEAEFNRDVAVKVLLPSLDERTQRRFERERRAMGSVSGHPNIVTVYRGGVTGSHRPYLVMEYLGGGSLADRLTTHGAMNWREAASIGTKLADAISVAHRAGILHRDIKPGNVFQSASGEPKLGDFGIARFDDGQESRSGSITASVAHAPPEIVDGQQGDERSDIYSLASTLYALASGHAPFAGDGEQGLARLLSRIANDPPPAPNLVPEAAMFESVLLQALSKDPGARPATVAEFGNQLQRSLQVTPTGQAGTTPGDAASIGITPAAGPSRSGGVGQLVGFVLLALAIAGFGGWAVARAVFGNNNGSGELTISATPAAQPSTPPDTPASEPTVAPTSAPTSAPAPAATVPAPTATSVPAPTATPVTLAGGRNGPAENPGYVLVSDSSGTISVEVPVAWESQIEDGEEPRFDDLDFSFRGLAVGGTFPDLGGDPEFRDLSQSGVSVFVARLDEPAGDIDGLLDESLEQWSDPACTLGERSQLQLTDGNAAFQILECTRPDGESTGVALFTMVPRADPNVAVAVNLQFSETVDLAALPIVTGSLRIDTERVPPFNG